MKKIITIVGSNSFLAGYLIESLKSKSVDLRLYGTKKPKKVECNFNYFNIPDRPLNISDIADSDVIIYTAGAGIQANLNQSVDLIYDLNVCEPTRILNNLIKSEYQGKFISFGSYFEIGENSNSHAYCEDEVVQSLNEVPNDYCVSKRMYSRYISSIKRKIDLYHFILPNIYGVGENESRVIPYVVNSILKNNDLSLTSGVQVRQFMHAQDVSDLTMLAIFEEHKGGIYNLAPNYSIKIKDLVIKIAEILGKTQDEISDYFGDFSRSDQKMLHLELNNNLLLDEFIWEPKINIEMGIRSYL
jgi:nucleoside-diphosphate-sugar epimerase